MRARPAADVDPGGLRPWFVSRAGDRQVRRAVSVGLGALVPVIAIVDVRHAGLSTGRSVVVVAVAALVGAALLLRTRWPVQVLAATLVGLVVVVLTGHVSPPLMFACEIALFTVASLRPRRTAGLCALVAAGVLVGVARTDLTGPVTEARTLILAVWTALFFALGVAVQSQRAYVTALAERARRADETREQEARTRVVEERVRIARELHDVVAHHIAVINVHAGLARRAIGRDAATVDSSLGHVQEAARTVLEELGSVLRVLRSPEAAAGDTAGAGTPSERTTEPVPGLDRLEHLLSTFAGVGLAVRTTTTGRPRAMDRASDLAAFRIIQESLTNAAKHGATGPVELGLSFAAEALTITVSNLVRIDPVAVPQGSVQQRSVPTPQHPGHGLIGMAERAHASGGTFAAHPDGRGGFRVVAVIPYRPEPS